MPGEREEGMRGDVASAAERAQRLSPARRELFERLRNARSRPIAEETTAIVSDSGSADPFPLTEVQQAYWIGRKANLQLGGVAAYGYAEFDVEGLDISALETSWNRLIERHPALRTVISENGTQRFLPSVPWYAINVADLRDLPADEVAGRLEEMRKRLSHRVPRLDEWPLFDVQATLLPGDRARVHVGFDTLIADALSFDILASELDVLLADPCAPLEPIGLTFRDYVLAVRAAAEAGAVDQARKYWFDRLDDLPPAPDLPLAQTGHVSHARFVRYGSLLSGDAWRALCDRAQTRRVTPPTALLCAYADVLTAWSGDRRFTVNLTLFNRRPVHPDVNRVVGCFTELSLLAVETSPSTTFEGRARQIQDRLWQDLEHRDVGAMTVLRELARRDGTAPLMPVVFTSALGTGAGGRSRLGLPVYAISQTPQVWIDHQVIESDDGIELWWDAADELFPPGMVREMFGMYVALVERLCESNDAWEAARPVSLPAPMLDARRRVEATSVSDKPALLHEIVDLRDAGRPAVVGAGGTLRRGELDVLAGRLAAALQAAGAARNRLVGILTSRGPSEVLAVLGVLRSGAGYLPLDPDLPADRLSMLIGRAGVELVVTDKTTSSVSLPGGVKAIRLDAGLPETAPRPHGCSPSDLAYVIFTSGSTGTPKGVMISHGAATNTLHDMRRRLSLTSDDAVLAVSDLSFDLSVFDIFGLLAAGGTIVTLAEGLRAKDPSHWDELLQRHGVTIWNSVPALMGLLVDHLAAADRVIKSLRVAVLSGDWIPVDLPDRIHQVCPNTTVLGAGGATEAAVWSVAYPIERVDPSWTSVPYGSPLTNQSVRVRDSCGYEAPDWVPGELHIGGDGVALGYWGEPALTADRFVPDPDRPGGRLYRTGDVARHLPHGKLEFLGRRDAHVKINGYRVDLAEVEIALASHPAVRQACAIATGPRDGARQLRAFVVPSAGIAVEDVRRHAASLLPRSMVPTVIETLDALPLTPNGKVDRARLVERPAPGFNRRATVATTGVARPVAEMIALVVAEVLKLDPPALDEDLLGLGADSVAIVRIGNELERLLGFAPPLERVFETPTVSGIAVECERHLLKQASRRCADDDRAWRSDGPPAPAVRMVPTTTRRIALPGSRGRAQDDWELLRSRRRPLSERVSLDAVGGLLQCLSVIKTPVGDRRLYASAGAIYPVRVYVGATDGTVEHLPPGVYYHDPDEHSLVSVGDGSPLRPEGFEPFVNGPIVSRAAFVVILTAYLPAIAPVYGAHAKRFATLEAGSMAQLLREAAPELGLGLCLIGDAAAPAVRAAAALADGEDVVVMLAGGLRDPTEPALPLPHPGAPIESGEL